MAERIAKGGHTAARKEGLGSAVIFRALAGNEIDAYGLWLATTGLGKIGPQGFQVSTIAP
jgi:hypothetical protein